MERTVSRDRYRREVLSSKERLLSVLQNDIKTKLLSGVVGILQVVLVKWADRMSSEHLQAIKYNNNNNTNTSNNTIKQNKIIII